MEFGKLENIQSVDWSLPATDPASVKYLNGLMPFEGKTEFRIGTPAWGRPEWVKTIYPPKTPANQFLHFYAKNFGCIELNTVHYRIPTAEQLKKWIEKVTPGFIFCPKIFNGISHSLEGLQDLALIRSWCETLPHYGEHLGPCFLQLPPTFDYSKKAALFQFLRAWPDEFELAIEFRHPSWLTPSRQVLPALGDYLRQRGIGLVLLDVAGRRDLLHTSISAPFTMLRFIGNDLDPSDFARSKTWAEKFLQWQEQGLERAYFFVHEPDDIKAPEMADQVVQDLNEICGAGLSGMTWFSEENPQAQLF